MNMQTIDWIIVLGLLTILTAAAIYTQRYTRSVSAFLAANRCGGRYLLSVASGMAQLGVITLVMFFEQTYEVGFTAQWWGMMLFPIGIFMAVSGWVYYRFRQTRALTLAQFFEMRYSRNFRVFAGLVAFLAGIINFAIFPAIGARFFIWLCGLSQDIELLGVTVAAYPFVMFCLLAISLTFTFLGGQIAIMVTDFIQGTLANIIFAIVVFFLLTQIDWSQITEMLQTAEAGKSMVNPHDLGREKNFDLWFYIIGVIIAFYSPLGWQGNAGYNSSAKSPHESKMATILGGWRWYVFIPLVVIVISLCAKTFMTHPDFAEDTHHIKQQYVRITAEGFSQDLAAEDINPNAKPNELQRQARIPLFLGAFLGKGLGKGLLGLVCAAMLGAFISTHDTYLHSWGSILVQDVILPFKKKPLSPKQHLWALRISIFLVAVWIFFFSLHFKQSQHIIMFTAVTASIFTGGVGAVIIGGLYWKKGSVQAAWMTMIAGMVFSFVGIFITQAPDDYFATATTFPFWQGIGKIFSFIGLEANYWSFLQAVLELTGQQVSFWVIGISVMTYVLVSLFGPKTSINMDKLLHRGKYAVQGEDSTSFKDAQTLLQKLGISREFTVWDKVVAAITLSWPMVWFLIFILGNTLHLYSELGISDQAWIAFWHKWTWLIFWFSVVLTVCFFIGGFRDVLHLFKTLRTAKVDEADDGRVEAHIAAESQSS